MKGWQWKWRWTAGLAALLVCLSTSTCSKKAQQVSPTFDDLSDKLSATEILPTLQSVLPKGKNAIWSASFEAAWQTLRNELGGEALVLDGMEELSGALNQALDPRRCLPEKAFYVAAGFDKTGGLAHVTAELKGKFPANAAPALTALGPNAVFLYACLKANPRFAIPYYQNPAPLDFTNSSGRSVEVRSFGLLAEKYEDSKQRLQPRVLFCPDDPLSTNTEFAVDLCTSSNPLQIVVARVSPERTLAATVDKVEVRNNDASAQTMGSGRLLIPEMYWALTHRFSQLEGRAFRNPKLAGQSLGLAQEQLFVHLDKSGAARKRQIKRVHDSGSSVDLLVDQPFLLYMKKRGAKAPYFAMWVDNAELLRPWAPESKSR